MNNLTSGILLLDKPSGISSHAALQKVKRLFRAKKVGHTGSLDPLASGMLPLCFGEATKFSQYLLAADKKYWVQAQLGIRTASGDSDSEVIATREVPALEKQQVDHQLQSFRGHIKQIPPMYSALKHQGQPLYKLARQGIEIERQSRDVTIYALDLLDYHDQTLTFEMHCSKGTYVRTLVDDLGELLGCGAHVITLRRLSVAQYLENTMRTLETLTQSTLEQCLLPTESMIPSWPSVNLTEEHWYYLRQGQAVMVSDAPAAGWVQLFSANGSFVGVGEMDHNGKVAPRRLMIM